MVDIIIIERTKPMEYNDTQYAEALEDFLLRMEGVSSEDLEGHQEAMKEIGKVLRISMIKAVFFRSLDHEQRGEGNESILYRSGAPDTDRSCCQREMTDDGNVIVYYVFQEKGEPEWSERELKRIQLVTKMLFVYNGRSRIMKRAEYLTFWDRDLKIHNLPYFFKYAKGLISQGRIGEFAVCYFNLKRFSIINQQVGRNNGNLVMAAFIQKLSLLFTNPNEELTCRIGGDNFVSIFYKKNVDAISKYLEGAEITIEHPIKMRFLISASAGFYLIPPDCTSPADIMDKVSTANNVAKNISQESTVFYSKEVMDCVDEIKMVQNLFSEAIENEEFLVYYQPKVYLKNYKMVGAEALCRWRHDGEIIPPARFIPILEQSKAICALDFYMLDHVCRDIRRWLDEGLDVVQISVNLSRCHFGNINLLEDILNIIDKNRVPHKYIEIELTETTTDVSFKDLRGIVFGLQEQGISTAVDDFGTGYSSLNLVRELPWNMLKIDKSFLEENENSPSQNYVMLKHIIAMSQEMGISSIVEGVETVEHVKRLKENNCYLAQGFCFDKPLPKDIFKNRLEALKAECI